jgi:hypothetical protein
MNRDTTDRTGGRRRVDLSARGNPCTNEGCLREAAGGEILCDTCQLERALYRRDERPWSSGRFRPAGR